jgi:hypothetical protein
VSWWNPSEQAADHSQGVHSPGSMLAGLPLVVIAAAAAALSPGPLALLAHPIQCIAMHCRR